MKAITGLKLEGGTKNMWAKLCETHFCFCLLYSLYHVAVIVGQVKEATTFTRRGELPKSVIPTDGYHVISCVHFEQFP